jgi:PKD domain
VPWRDSSPQRVLACRRVQRASALDLFRFDSETLMRHRLFDRLVSLVAIALALVGCGGGDDGSAVVPVPNPVPSVTAAFSAPATSVAGQAVVFDAGASTSSDGSALSYAWDFGNGMRGGGRTIARSFAAAGDRSVTLTVTDGAGRQATQSRTVTVSGLVPSGSVAAQGRVAGLDAVALEGVTVTLASGGSQGATLATSDAAGKLSLTLDKGVPVVLKLAKSGYADQFVPLQFPDATTTDAYFTATMRSRDAAQTLADAAAGGTLTARDGALITLPAGALVDGSGNAVSGPVQIAMTPIDVTAPNAGGFPGSFDGIQPDGTTTPIVSFGTTEFVLSAGGQRLQIAAGKSATIELPVYATKRLDGTLLAAGSSVPLWSLDETTGSWIQEGTGTVVASAGSPTGLAMRAVVAHMSWWNVDIGFDPYGPAPGCVYDTDSGNPGGNDTFATATICNMLAEIDNGLGTSLAVKAVTLPGRAFAQAVPLSPRIAGFSRRLTVPVGGGVTLPVPANFPVRLSAQALNGTWSGSLVVNGAVGVREPVIVKLRPTNTLGTTTVPITLPYDASQALISGQTGLYSFTGTADTFARITASTVTSSALTGRVRLLKGGATIGTADFTPTAASVILLPLPADGSYTVEVTGLSNTPGSYRLQVGLLGGARQSEAVSYPFDVTKTLTPFTIYRANFSVAAAGAVYVAAAQPAQAAPARLRVLAADGTVLAVTTSFSGTPFYAPIVVLLPAGGSYTAEFVWTSEQAGSVRLSGEPTSWVPVASAPDFDVNGQVIDLVADRNGRPVIGYQSPIIVASRQTGTATKLRRWNGSAWESVGPDLTVDGVCSTTSSSGVPAAFAFDSANNPVIAYANGDSTGATFTVVRKLVAGTWQGVGSSTGQLPKTSTSGASCSYGPALALDASDRPLVAYRADGQIWVQRFDGVAWKGLVSTSGDSFNSVSGGFDLGLDPSGQAYLVFNGSASATVLRFSSTPGVGWENVGPGGGQLPELNTGGLYAPRLRFAQAGRPVVASVARVATEISGVFSSGVVVYRYDGSTWLTTGGYRTDPSSYLNGQSSFSFAMSGADALVGWFNSSTAQPSGQLVQKNTTSGWSAVGPGTGVIPQYSEHGITPALTSGFGARLLQTGTELYQSLVVLQPGSVAGTSGPSVVLLKKVGP